MKLSLTNGLGIQFKIEVKMPGKYSVGRHGHLMNDSLISQ